MCKKLAATDEELESGDRNDKAFHSGNIAFSGILQNGWSHLLDLLCSHIPDEPILSRALIFTSCEN